MMQLEVLGADAFLARGPQYPWGGLYGGQIIAQALRAGAATVDERFHVHSLHAYFIRRGDADQPIHLDVTRSRDGRSFVTRTVVASQEHVGVILTASLSFQVDEAGHDVQTARLPDIQPADGLDDSSWSSMFDRRFARLRGEEEGRGVAWLRLKDPVGDDPVLQACAVAYLSDDLPTDAVVALHPERPPAGEDAFEHGWMSASLDHAIWFHRPSRADAWHVHDFTSHGYLSSRGLSVGHVLSEDGVHVATIAQEVLLRKSRDL